MDDDMANIIVAQLLYLDAVDPTKVRFFNYIWLNFISSSSMICLACSFMLLDRILSCMWILLVALLLLVIFTLPYLLLSFTFFNHSSISLSLFRPPGMAIFDTMRHIRPDVSTVCVGLAARYHPFTLIILRLCFQGLFSIHCFLFISWS